MVCFRRAFRPFLFVSLSFSLLFSHLTSSLRLSRSLFPSKIAFLCSLLFRFRVQDNGGSASVAFLYKGFLSEKECDHLITLAKDKLERLTVADESGKSTLEEVRTSSEMFLSKAQDEIVTDIEARIATWTFLPIVCFQLHGMPTLSIVEKKSK